MKKKLIMIAAGALAAILLLVAYLVLSKNETPGQNNDTPKKQVTYIVNGFSEENISSVAVFKNKNPLYRIYLDPVTNSFLLEGHEAKVYSDAFKRVLTRASKMFIIQNIEDPLEDSEYGIAGEYSPYVIELQSTDGRKETVYVGDSLLDGSGYYCRTENGTVCGVTSYLDEIFVNEYDLISKLLAYPIDQSSYHYTERFAMYKDMQKLVEIELVPEDEREGGNVYGYYRMTYPAEYTPSDVFYDALLKNLVSPEADSIVTTEITPENLTKYGFDTPTYEIYYTHDGTERKLFFGNRTEDGLIYVLSYDFEFIGLVGISSHFPFLDSGLIDFINPLLFGINIDYISKISVSGKDFSDTYTLSGSGSDLVVTAANGGILNTQNFRQFYRVLLMTRMSGYADEKKTDDKILSFTIETKSGKSTQYDFYQTSTRKCFYTVNGKGEFYVSIDEAEKIVSDAKKLRNGETINADAQM